MELRREDDRYLVSWSISATTPFKPAYRYRGAMREVRLGGWLAPCLTLSMTAVGMRCGARGYTWNWDLEPLPVPSRSESHATTQCNGTASRLTAVGSTWSAHRGGVQVFSMVVVNGSPWKQCAFPIRHLSSPPSASACFYGTHLRSALNSCSWQTSSCSVSGLR
jgi:hypothetical protein